LLFVHGFPEFWFSWRYQLKEFSNDYWCIAIDQRGYSQSDKPTSISDYNIDNMVADIYELVKLLGMFDIVISNIATLLIVLSHCSQISFAHVLMIKN
jgi:hypothetical protein